MNEQILKVKNLKKFFIQGGITLKVLENLNMDVYKKDIIPLLFWEKLEKLSNT